MKIHHKILLYCFPLVLITACQEVATDKFLDKEYEILSQHLNLPEEVHDYTIRLPEHLDDFVSESEGEKEPKFDYKATLGRVLFYDTRLSSNNSVSCATCHQQDKGFADNSRFSEGFNGDVGHRNTIALATTVGFETSYGGGNSDFSAEPLVKFSWDDTVRDLHKQSELAITSPIEMGMTMQEVVSRIEQEDFYGILFKNAFGDLQVTEDRMLDALTSFCNSIASVNTKFDQALNSEGQKDFFSPFPAFTQEENFGKQIFNDNCASCHGFNHSLLVRATGNNGLDMNYKDQGKGAKTGLQHEMGIFKIPFLRNIALTAPYMHDGRFSTLEEVVDHYSEGIQNHENLSFDLKEFDRGNPMGKAKKFNFSDVQKEALIAYLHTLTDTELHKDERFANPFKE